MAYRDVAVAGVPSERLSQLASPQLAQRPRRENAFGTLHSAFHDEMSAILRPCNNSSKEESPRQLEAAAPVGYAGKTTAQLNSSRFTHGSKKQSAAANTSGQIACLFSGRSGSPQVHPRGGTRPLKQYIAPDQLPEAFCTKFQVTDPFTGRTEIMTARRPGKAAAEINLASFDSYMLPRERTFSLQKAKDNIDHSILGLMPKVDKELKFSVGTISRQHREPTLECKEDWMAPTAAANVCKPLGLSKRHTVFPWTPTDTNITQVFNGQTAASPRTTRACIRPAFISS